MYQRRNTKAKSSREEKEVIDVARIKQLQEMAAAAQPQYGVKEVTEEAWLLTKLAFLLLRFLMGSYKWIVRVARLSAFVLLLSPALLPMAYRYFKSPNIIRDVRYGPHARNFLDIYVPPYQHGRRKGSRYPVAIFFTGGAWTIGYKGWSGLFSDAFMEEGILYVTPDYRNFPQGYGNEMAEDVERAIAWVIQNIELYGGDPENVTVVGQSAGAHLSSFVLVRKATEELEAKLRGESEAQRRKSEAESRGDDEVKPMRERREVNAEEIENGTGKAKWSTKQIKKFIGVSGPYDLAGYVGYLHSRGLPNYLLYSIFQGELSRYSPTRIVQDLCKKYKLVDASGSIALPFPPTVLVHGTADVTMPSKASEEFGKALEEIGVKVDVKLHLGKTHTDCIMEDIFLGENVMLTDIVKAITDTSVAELVKGQDQEQDSASEEEQETTTTTPSEEGVAAKVVATAEEQLRRAERKWRRLAPAYYPGFLVRTAQKVNPF
jgi:prenylcysteine alpha-carboxyl methylesterase